MNEASYTPAREAVFNETLQIAIVVRDLEATLRRYVDDYGIGPWQLHEFTEGILEDLREHDQPVKDTSRFPMTRFATTMVGQVMWELIEPLDQESTFARFLAEKGEGVHHIAVGTPRFDDAVTEQAERGSTLPLSGTFGDAKLAYLPTDRDLGVIVEIFSGMPGAEPEPDAT